MEFLRIMTYVYNYWIDNEHQALLPDGNLLVEKAITDYHIIRTMK